jgi:hypothetical protein
VIILLLSLGSQASVCTSGIVGFFFIRNASCARLGIMGGTEGLFFYFLSIKFAK